MQKLYLKKPNVICCYYWPSAVTQQSKDARQIKCNSSCQNAIAFICFLLGKQRNLIFVAALRVLFDVSPVHDVTANFIHAVSNCV